jgi:hypothetical protein
LSSPQPIHCTDWATQAPVITSYAYKQITKINQVIFGRSPQQAG